MSRMVSLTILSSLLLASCQMRTAPVAAPIDTPDMNTPVNDSKILESVVLPLGMDEEGVAALANQLTQTTGLVVTPVAGSTAIIDSQGKTYITSRFRVTRSNAAATADLRNLTFVLASRSAADPQEPTAKPQTIDNTTVSAIYQRIGTRDVQITDAALLKKIARTVKPTGGQMYAAGAVSVDDPRRTTAFRAPTLDARYRASLQGFLSSDFDNVGTLPTYTTLIPAGFLAQPVAGSTTSSRAVSSGVELTVSVYFPTPTDARGQAMKVSRVDLNGVLLKNDKAMATESLEHQALFDSGTALRQHIADSYAPSTNLQPITVLNLLPGSAFASMPLSSVKSFLGSGLSEVRNICSIQLSTDRDAMERVYLVGNGKASQDPTVKSDLKTFFKTTDPLKLSMGCADDGNNLAKRLLIHGGQTGQRLDNSSNMVYNKGIYKLTAATASMPIEASYMPQANGKPQFGWKPGERVVFTYLNPSQSNGMLQGEFRVATQPSDMMFQDNPQPTPQAPETSGTSIPRDRTSTNQPAGAVSMPIDVNKDGTPDTATALPDSSTGTNIVLKITTGGVLISTTTVSTGLAPIADRTPVIGGVALADNIHTCIAVSNGDNSVAVMVYDKNSLSTPSNTGIILTEGLQIDKIEVTAPGDSTTCTILMRTTDGKVHTASVALDTSIPTTPPVVLQTGVQDIQIVDRNLFYSMSTGLYTVPPTPIITPAFVIPTTYITYDMPTATSVILGVNIPSFAINGDMAMIQTPDGLEVRRYTTLEPAISRWIISSQGTKKLRMSATATGFAAYDPSNNPLKTTSTLMNTTGFTSLGEATPVVTETNTRPGFDGNSVVMGDIDSDGDLDVITDSIPPQDNVTDKPQLIIQINNGEGVFGPGPTTTVGSTITVDHVAPIDLKIGTTKAALGLVDLNGDGKLDLISANEGANEVQVFTNTTSNGKAAFTLAQTLTAGISGPQAVVSGDFNRDGKMDFAVANKGNRTLSVFMNNGNMTFTQTNLPQADAATAGAPVRLAVGDLNGDGRLEVVSANADQTLSIFKPLGGAPQPQVLSLPGVPSAVAVGDLNGDGRLDVVASMKILDQVAVLVNDATNGLATVTTFDTGTGTQPVDVDLGDFDGDGQLDIMTANEGMGEMPGTLSLLVNTPELALGFVDAMTLENSVAGKGKALAVGSLKHTAMQPDQTLDSVFLINDAQDGARLFPKLGQ